MALFVYNAASKSSFVSHQQGFSQGRRPVGELLSLAPVSEDANSIQTEFYLSTVLLIDDPSILLFTPPSLQPLQTTMVFSSSSGLAFQSLITIEYSPINLISVEITFVLIDVRRPNIEIAWRTTVISLNY